MSDVRDYDLDDEIVADSPKRLKALGDPLRSQLCDLVLERAMSVGELAARVRRPKGSVAHHVGVLVDAGLLKVVRTRKVRAVEERFYGRVARTFVLPSSPGFLPFVDEMRREIDHERFDDEQHGVGTITLRRARIPAARAQEYVQRLHDLSLEFVDEPRAGDTEFGMLLMLYPTTRTVTPGSDAP